MDKWNRLKSMCVARTGVRVGRRLVQPGAQIYHRLDLDTGLTVGAVVGLTHCPEMLGAGRL